jgi:hypothetical protein
MAAYQDLLKDNSVAVENGNYFIVTVTDLELNENYPIQFRWKYQDGTFGLWSVSKLLTTPGETLPGSPNLSLTDVVGDDGFIKITWNGNDKSGKPITNIDRIDIFIDGSPFDATKAAASFKVAGTQTIAAPAGEYLVALYAISNYGSKSAVSDSRSVIVYKSGQSAIDPEDPSAPEVTAGLASVIVEWDGKKNDGEGGVENFTPGSFAGAKVFIGTTSDFVANDNNWVHTLNFANGSNKVSIGVGTVINKSTGATLQYGVPYYVKIDTINSNNIANGQPVSAGGNPITVDRLPASEIKTGTLEADASVTAGIDGGSRVVLSGGENPLVIYGTDGETELLKFIGGSTGTLAINGSGTFTGNLSIGSEDTVFKADPAIGIWLGDADYADADFRVNTSGVLRAKAGTVGGWTLAESYLQNSLGTIKINSGDSPSIYLGPASGAHIRLTPDSITHYFGGTQSNKFTLTTSNGNISLAGDITAGSTITGSTITGSTISGGSVISTGTSPFSGSGTLTINSGYISHTSGIYLNSPEFFAGDINGGGQISITSNGQSYMGDSSSSSLAFRIMIDQGLTNYARGYHLQNLGTTAFSQSDPNGFSPSRTVVVANDDGWLQTGRAFFYGSAGTSSAIHSNTSGIARIGDVYFSTS